MLFLLRYGANPQPRDDGCDPVLALLDKLLECDRGRYPVHLVSCLRILVRAAPVLDLPFKVTSLGHLLSITTRQHSSPAPSNCSPVSTEYAGRSVWSSTGIWLRVTFFPWTPSLDHPHSRPCAGAICWNLQWILILMWFNSPSVVLLLLLRMYHRFVIREELRKNFQLPHGVNVLPVPLSLKRYLDLIDEEEEEDNGRAVEQKNGNDWLPVWNGSE